jgi:hypothetical protein
MYNAVRVESDRVIQREPRPPRPERERPDPTTETLDPATIISLQRTFGNQAVARMPMLQRFRASYRGGATKQVSENSQIVFEGPKRLFATSAAIRTAANALTAVGAVVTIRSSRDDTTYNIDGQDYSKVELAINPQAVRGALYTRLQSKQPDDGGFGAFADCYRTSATTTGFNPSDRNEPAAELRLPTGVVPVMTNKEALTHGVDQTPAGRAAASFLLDALPKFVPVLQAEPAPPPEFAGIIQQLTQYATKAAGSEKTNHGRRIYKAILAQARAKALFSSTFGINQDITPAVGTQLTQYNDPAEKAEAETRGESKWNFHWAGVILTDGSDYVTLENCAVELDDATAQEIAANSDAFHPDHTVKHPRFTKQDQINDRWYFKLYGQGAQSFHAQMLNDPHATESALTVPINKH